MLNPEEREQALKQMKVASGVFYHMAQRIGVHPFIEFTGLMNEYIKACEQAHAQGIDFSDCTAHSGLHLPLRPYEVDYINEKLECIFTGRSVMAKDASAQIAPDINMNQYEIALVVIVRQRGADASDAADRALFNLQLREGHTLSNPEPSNCGVQAGPVVVVCRPNVIMIKASEKST